MGLQFHAECVKNALCMDIDDHDLGFYDGIDLNTKTQKLRW